MPTERFSITNRRGKRLVGLIDYPAGTSAVGKLFVACHGYGGNKEGRYLRTISDTLTTAGMGNVRFDFTNGAGESEGVLSNASVAGYADDLDDVLDYLGALPRLARSAVAIAGHSYAGRVALVVAARRPAIAAVFFLSAVYPSNEFDIPAIVAAVQAPIFVIHGSADREVALSNAEALQRVAGDKIAGVTIIAGADHNYTLAHSADKVAAAIQEALATLAVGPTG
ncbi:MAG TPA: alpha/beta family hydrolase [Chloroflexota bacterium]|nr:alpha/beta family hydrolase [Chloroflexota bacterium]